ncbi:hypothetical protein Fmac_024231 [Flemingia macrophylla]|uniref:Uncharacterized protein n=1 Tax=Flemingia macrophylla TaxID=520843 RepID=A0ABD1LPC1_9FABA
MTRQSVGLKDGQSIGLKGGPACTTRHYLLHSSSSSFTRSSTPLSRPSAKPLRVPALHLHGLHESSTIAPPRLHPESCVHPQGLPVDHSTTVSLEIYGFIDPNLVYSQSPFESATVENRNGYGIGEGVFVSDGLVLPPSTEMEPEEGYALLEWRR